MSDHAYRLRAMAAERLVISPCSGTLDADRHGETRLCVTGTGEVIFGHLWRLREWVASCTVGNERPSGRRSAVHDGTRHAANVLPISSYAPGNRPRLLGGLRAGRHAHDGQQETALCVDRAPALVGRLDELGRHHRARGAAALGARSRSGWNRHRPGASRRVIEKSSPLWNVDNSI